MKTTAYFLFSFFLSGFLWAQSTFEIKGQLVDAQTLSPVEGAWVEVLDSSINTLSEVSGTFKLIMTEKKSVKLLISADQYLSQTFQLDLNQLQTDLGIIQLVFDRTLQQQTLFLTDETLVNDEAEQSVAMGLLQASRDVFYRTAAYDFSPVYFRPGGYDSRETSVMINGIRLNGLDTGRPQWSEWGGLNEVTRNQEFTAHADFMDQGFGGVGGTTLINIRAREFRRGFSVSSAASNRSYLGRFMGTYHSGLGEKGWAYSLSASRRWGDEGFVEGTPYYAASGFVAVEKALSSTHSIQLLGLYTPNHRGIRPALTEEVYNLKGSAYNPNWGYQNGKKRMATVRKTEKPLVMLSHYFETNKLSITTQLAYQFGFQSRSRLSYQNAQNPSPIYYKNLPSYYLNLGSNNAYHVASAAAAKASFLEQPQLNWESFYRVNDENPGAAAYALYEDKSEDRQWFLHSRARIQHHDFWYSVVGVNLRQLNTEHFGMLTDLLGAQYFYDYDPFNNTANNLDENPNKKVGDYVQYRYLMDSSEMQGFVQTRYQKNKVDFFISGFYSLHQTQRNGLFNNELFKDAKGRSERVSFGSWGIKSGYRYSLDGGHFLQLIAGYQMRPPTIRNSFANARVSNQLVPELNTEKLLHSGIHYRYRSSKINVRLTAYYSKFWDASQTRFFYAEGLALGNIDPTLRAITEDFVAESVIDIQKLHQGVEFGLETKINETLTASGVAALGQHSYANNPQVYITSDQIPMLHLGTASLKNYRLAQGPQKAYSVGLNYRHKNFWWMGTTANYLLNNFADISALLRTPNFFINPEDPDGFPFPEATENAARLLLKQTALDNVFLVNFVGGKSWRFKNRNYLGLFVSLNNLLNKNFRTGGFEQARASNFRTLSADRAQGTPAFGPRFYYGYGRSYFINLSYRF